MIFDLATHRWHKAIIKDAEVKLGRPLKDYEKTFITSRGGFIALEMIHDTVKAAASKEELEKYLASEQPKPTTANPDPYNLDRFILAQEQVYDTALEELQSGQKETHWMWFIFPQIAGLGVSSTSTHYAIKSLDEARAYLQHPVLGTRLRVCANTVLKINGRTASDIFGYPDDLKLKSSMTLFEAAAVSDSAFAQVLAKYFNGERDEKTLQILRTQGLA
ncbi:MAG: hypothetical protein PCFJNLEI_02033 [Verrucomicrobiae bacterium]|nr:hypothetical protein [Verrucomicrobiae bacterium]